MYRLGASVNLVICQKSKVDDWLTHFDDYYPEFTAWDLTNKHDYNNFFKVINGHKKHVGVINYDLIHHRPDFLKLENFTLVLDESSMIQNETTKRAKFIMRLKFMNLVLLSGTPTSGKYENLYSQLNMLGYAIRKQAFFNMYVESHVEKFGDATTIRVIDGYKNVDHLKRKMRRLGCDFLKTDEVLTLPQQNFIPVRVPASDEYNKFKKTKVVEIDGVKLVGDTVLTELLNLRKLCGMYSREKLQAFADIIESTNAGLIVFYNFNDELNKLTHIVTDAGRPISIVNGSVKDLDAYNNTNNAVVFVQYQAGAMGLNLQKYNQIVYFTPTLSSELYEQSKKRINRIGQTKTCFYYNLVVSGSIEGSIYKTLAMRRDYTNELFAQNKTQ